MMLIVGLFCGAVLTSTAMITFAIFYPQRTKAFLWPHSRAAIYRQGKPPEYL